MSILVGNCPSGELSVWGIVRVGNCPVGNCPSGELSEWGIVQWGIVLVGNCPVGNCPFTVDPWPCTQTHCLHSHRIACH